MAQIEAPRTRPRASASAAAVPMGMASATAPAVTRRLFHIARWNCGYVTTFTYQRSESPFGGNDRIAVGLNETAITTTVGSVMNARRASTASRNIRRPGRPPR